MKRIIDRIRLVCDHARNNGVRIAIQNGGSFASAAELTELIDRVNSPQLGAAYDVVAGVEADDDPADAIALLGPRLLQARLGDVQGQNPVAPGEGESQCKRFVEALIETDFSGWLVYEWPALFLPGLAGADVALPKATEAVYGWLASAGVHTDAPSASA